MYEGIFEDVRVVKEVLASHGHKSVDETLVFELLEDLKVKEQVVKVILGTRLRPNADSPTSSFRSDSNGSWQGEARDLNSDDFLYHSDNLYDSDGLEILEDISYGPEHFKPSSRPVDLKMKENRASPDLPIVLEETAPEEAVIEVIAKESDKVGVHETVQVLADSTEKGSSIGKGDSTRVEAKKELCVNDNWRDIFYAKNDDVDATNSTTDSEDVEMDDYYMRPDMDSEESVGFGGSDGKVSLPPSPILRMQDEFESANFERHNNDASNLEPVENRMEEMLEENNNDPNNNLEDIQVIEQNNISSTVVDNLSNLDKETTAGSKCLSPKPGCSKDSYYTDSDVCVVEDSGKRKLGTSGAENKSRSSAVGNETNSFASKDSFDRTSPRMIDEKMTLDFESIKKVLPNVCSSYVWSYLMTNRDAINRIELTLWDLLPEKRPLPILPAKRKQEGDNSLSPLKKFVSEESVHSNVNSVDFSPIEERSRAQASLHAKSRIIQPAKLSISGEKTNILHPHKSASFSNYRSSSAAPSAESSKSTVKLKPSALQSVHSRYAYKTVRSKFDPSKFFLPNSKRVNLSGATSTREKKMVRPSFDEADPVSKKQPFLTIQSLPPVVVKELKTNSAKLNPQITGAIPKKVTHYYREKPVFNDTLPNPIEFGGFKPWSGSLPSASKLSSSSTQHQAPSLKAGQMDATEAKLLAEEIAHQKHSNKSKPEVTHRLQQPIEDLGFQNNAILDQINKVMNFEIEKAVEDNRPAVKASENPIAVPGPENAPAAVQTGAKVKPANRVVERDVVPPRELFNPLINMFPDVDPFYIADLCRDAQLMKKNLESLVEILLVKGLEHPRIVNPEPEPQEVNPDAQYENLLGIFPDAYPEYLRKIAERYYNDPEAIKDFVQSKLEKRDYPTMADYLKKIKITEQIKQYTVDFNPEKFLEIFPNPFKHFEDPKRVYRYNVIAFEFLKFLFRGNKVATILRVYKLTKPQCHLSLAAKELEHIGPDMKSRRTDKLLPTEDIPLLQEFAFLQHKAQIKDYMNEQKRKEKKEFKRLKDNNELVECQCCFDSECMPSKCSRCSEGHIFCKSCIKLGSATKIGEGQTQFPCFVDCQGEFSLPVLQTVLEPTMFSILLRKRQEKEVKAAGLEGLVSCPFCHFASIPPPEDKVFKCLNPECMKESCRFCKELNHVPLRCDEVSKGEEARRSLEEKMTEALVRKCYQCSSPFFKDEGCNKMTCPCGATTCYICGERVKDYTHFNGQGADRTDLCPLWSDNKILNAQTVRVVAEAAEREILERNPHLKIDAKALMPALPEATRGPHEDIANAHILPVHTRRA